MKTLNYIKILLLSIICIGFTSCEDDQDGIESAIVGRFWTGDLGMSAENGEAIFSTFRFGIDGFGEEKQYYELDGEFYRKYRFQWWWEDRYNRNMILDYGKYGISYMDDIRVSGNQLWGRFFLEDGSRGFDFTLYME